MSLPTAFQNTQYYLQAGYGLACAVASTEMALFVGALSLRFDLLRFGPLGALSLRFDPFRGVSFAVRSVSALSQQRRDTLKVTLTVNRCGTKTLVQ
jgi:hypothetical protein